MSESIPILGAHLSDEEVANRIGSLLRTDPHREDILLLARDRILALSQALEPTKREMPVLKAALKEARDDRDLFAAVTAEARKRLKFIANLNRPHNVDPDRFVFSLQENAAQALVNIADPTACLKAHDAQILAAETSLMQDDLAKILQALGLGDHARPQSPHQVVLNEVLPAIQQLVGARGGRKAI